MRRVSPLLLLVACGGGPGPAVTVEGAPLLLAAEGVAVELAIGIADAPATGDCAPPLAPERFTLEVAGADAGRFEQLAIGGALGAPVLAVAPACGAIERGGADVLVDLELAAAGGCAAPAPLRLQLGDSPGEPCWPRVSAWLGDCGAPPADAGTVVAVPAVEVPPALCVHVVSRDPAGERLWLRSSSSAPPGLIRAGDAPSADDFSQVTITVPLYDSREIRGLFHIDWWITRQAPVPGDPPPEIGGTIDLLVGEPGLSIDVAGSGSALEFDVARIAFRVWALPAPTGAGESLCARARRAPPPVQPLPRAKPFLRLEASASAAGGGEDVWVCGEQFMARVSPPIDAPPIETVELEAAVCTSCDTLPAPSGEVVAYPLPVPVISPAEQVRCGPTDASDDIQVACADLAGDFTPELVFRHLGGTGDRACAWTGATGRLAPAPFAAGSTEVPQELASFTWRDPVAGPTPIVLGRFAAQPHLRALAFAGTPIEAVWNAAAPLGLAPAVSLALTRTRGLAADPTEGSTHLAAPVGPASRDVQIRCVAPADPAITGCADVLLADLAPPGHGIADLGVADLDGDGTEDLIAFATETSPPFASIVVAALVAWPTAGAPQLTATAAVASPAGGTRFPSGAIDGVDCSGPACRQLLFAAPLIDGVERTVMMVLRMPGVPASLEAIELSALHEVRDVAALAGRMYFGMDFEVAQMATNGSDLIWAPRDPVVREDLLVGPIAGQPAGYGRSLSACRAGVDAIAFTVDTSASRMTAVDLDVLLP